MKFKSVGAFIIQIKLNETGPYWNQVVVGRYSMSFSSHEEYNPILLYYIVIVQVYDSNKIKYKTFRIIVTIYTQNFKYNGVDS